MDSKTTTTKTPSIRAKETHSFSKESLLDYVKSTVPDYLLSALVSMPAQVELTWSGDTLSAQFAELVMQPISCDLKVALVPDCALPYGPEALSVIALYPSGALRTVGTATMIDNATADISLFDYWSILDPEGDDELGVVADASTTAIVFVVKPE